MNLDDWADKWGVPQIAISDLLRILGQYAAPPIATPVGPARNEADVMNLERLKASRKGARLWRNNVGACHTDTGSFLRYGLANESAQMNKQIKSSDLIGIRPVSIEPVHVGSTIGQFVARECKRPGWKFTGTEREQAQLNFINLVVALGGDAKFTTGVE